MDANTHNLIDYLYMMIMRDNRSVDHGVPKGDQN